MTWCAQPTVQKTESDNFATASGTFFARVNFAWVNFARVNFAWVNFAWVNFAWVNFAWVNFATGGGEISP